MKSRHTRTLEAVFKRPTSANITFTDLETLVGSLDGAVREGDGSRIVFEPGSRRLYMHRPHPGKEAKRYQVEALRAWLESAGIKP